MIAVRHRRLRLRTRIAAGGLEGEGGGAFVAAEQRAQAPVLPLHHRSGGGRHDRDQPRPVLRAVVHAGGPDAADRLLTRDGREWLSIKSGHQHPKRSA